MPKFLSSHTLPAGALKREQVEQLARAAQSDPVVKPYRSFLNLAEGKVVCNLDNANTQFLSLVYESDSREWPRRKRVARHANRPWHGPRCNAEAESQESFPFRVPSLRSPAGGPIGWTASPRG